MGFFRKGKSIKPGKIYNMTEAIQIAKDPEYEDYTAQEVPGGYIFMKVVESKVLEKQLREKQEFHNRMNGNGIYRNIIVEPQQYNNWQVEVNREHVR